MMNKMAKFGLFGLIGFPLIAFSPLALAYLTTPAGGNMWSEGGSGGGSAIWLMILTLPLGGIGLLVSLILLIVGLATKR